MSELSNLKIGDRVTQDGTYGGVCGLGHVQAVGKKSITAFDRAWTTRWGRPLGCERVKWYTGVRLRPWREGDDEEFNRNLNRSAVHGIDGTLIDKLTDDELAQLADVIRRARKRIDLTAREQARETVNK